MVVAGGKEHAVTPNDATPVCMRERSNGLLAALPAGELARIAPYLALSVATGTIQ
jgi:hypothetical protein